MIQPFGTMPDIDIGGGGVPIPNVPSGAELFYAIRWFFMNVWRFFTELTIPGTSITFAALFVGLFLAVFSLRILGFMFGFGGGVSSNTIIGAFGKRDEKGFIKPK